MTRYIDADAYLQKICTYNETGCGSCKFQTKCPADEPTIEAEPKHGKWVPMFNGEYTGGAYWFECSECKMVVSGGLQSGNWFCKGCGAKMEDGK